MPYEKTSPNELSISDQCIDPTRLATRNERNEHPDQAEPHQPEYVCGTMRLLRSRTEKAQAAYLERFGTLPNEATMLFVNHWDVPDVLEDAVIRNKPIEPSKAGIEFETLCREYLERFGHKVIPQSMWLWGSAEDIARWIKEALLRNRRRWVLECGNALDGRDAVFVAAGLDPEQATIEDMLHIWLDPIESFREFDSTNY